MEPGDECYVNREISSYATTKLQTPKHQTYFRQSFCITPQNNELMKQNQLLGLLLLASAMTLSSCEVIGDIFQAGMFVGVLIVVVIIALVIWLFRRR